MHRSTIRWLLAVLTTHERQITETDVLGGGGGAEIKRYEFGMREIERGIEGNFDRMPGIITG